MNGEASNEDEVALAGSFVLGMLGDAESADAEQLLAWDSGFAREVHAWRERLSPLDASAKALPPPAALWQRIEASTATARPQKAREPARRPAMRATGGLGLWQAIEFWRWTAIGGAVATFAMVVLAGTLLLRWPSQPIMVAVLSVDGSGKPGAVVESFADGSVRLIPLQAIDVPEGRALQVWTLRDRQEGPISVGLLDKARTVHLRLGKLPAPRVDQLFEITLEPDTGSPTGRPTGPVLMKGLTANTL
jgi:anti-sigma-K factor RskA